MRDSYVNLIGTILLSVAILVGSAQVAGELQRISHGTDLS